MVASVSTLAMLLKDQGKLAEAEVLLLGEWLCCLNPDGHAA